MPKPLINICRAGRLSYATGQLLQKSLSEQQINNNPHQFQNYLILQEFNPVYTIGIRTKGYNQSDEHKLRNLGADFYRTNRGGLITYHGPGQLVAYFILHLHQFKPSMRWYVSTLEQTVINLCTRMGIKAGITQNTGIWVDDRKICAVGVHGSRYVTTHGIGLNCCTDLKWFENIVPCGIEGKGVTSLSVELNRHVAVEEAADVLINSIADIFNCHMAESEVKIKQLMSARKV